MNEPEVDATATAELVVTHNDLASALPLDFKDKFPAVFATARMVALMEIASARLLQPCLQSGELSVGVSIEATHNAPTPLGMTVTAPVSMNPNPFSVSFLIRPSAIPFTS